MATMTKSATEDGRGMPKSAVSVPDVSWFNRHEAAFFAAVSLGQVNKAIEEKVVRARRPRPHVTFLDRADVAAIAVLGQAELQLPRQTKCQIRSWVRQAFEAPEIRHEEIALGDVLLFRPDPTLEQIAADLDAYIDRRARYIAADPEVRDGEPVISGTRLPVHSVAARLQRGDSPADLAEDYPGIPEDAFEAARIYADSHPRRGRPARPCREGQLRQASAMGSAAS